MPFLPPIASNTDLLQKHQEDHIISCPIHSSCYSPWQLQQYCHTSGIGLLQEQRLKDHHKTSQVNTVNWIVAFLIIPYSGQGKQNAVSSVSVLSPNLSWPFVSANCIWSTEKGKHWSFGWSSISIRALIMMQEPVSALLMVSWHPRGTNGSVNCIQLFGKETSWSFFISVICAS